MTELAETQTKEITTPIFQLKGSLFTLTVMQLLEYNLDVFSHQLRAMVEQAPKFFKNAPVVIDLNKLNDPNADIHFTAIVQELRVHGLIPVGVRGSKPNQQPSALAAGLAILSSEVKVEPAASASKQTTSQPTPIKSTAKLITSPVRSGQQLYANGGDLVILAPVSPGAELLADGNIHVYAPLRGRALAGVSGDQEARIFCQSLEAELVSIAGYYWVKEDLKSSVERKAVQIYLENDRLKIETL